MFRSTKNLTKLSMVSALLLGASVVYAYPMTSGNKAIFALGTANNSLLAVQKLILASGMSPSQIHLESGHSARIAENANFDVIVFASPKVANTVSKKTGSVQQVVLGAPQLAAYCANCQGSQPLASMLKSGSVNSLVYADPKDAPVGEAAQAVINKMKYPVKNKVILVHPKGVMDYQSTQADVIFTTTSALSFRGINTNNANKVVVYPANNYRKIDLTQVAILTNQGKNNAKAQQFMNFLASCKASQLLAQNGYTVNNKTCQS